MSLLAQFLAEIGPYRKWSILLVKWLNQKMAIRGEGMVVQSAYHDQSIRNYLFPIRVFKI